MYFTNFVFFSHDLLANIIYSRVEKPQSMLFYVIEPANWSIKWDGKYITKNLNEQKLIKARITTICKGICNQIVHFGSINTFLNYKNLQKRNKYNKIIFTWFHFEKEDKRIKLVKNAQKYVDFVHTSNSITKQKLIEIGIMEEKIVVVPLGVDLSIFKPLTKKEKERIKKELGLPENKIIIGSFQKDGVGWKEGLNPKFVKGADIFIKVLDKLKKDYDVFVLLLGPARGYVKRELQRINVPYMHTFLKNYLKIPKYYNALDIYLITSRAEGGPKAIHESMASKIPLVSTKVGMAKDIIKNGQNGFLADVDDVEMLYENIVKIIENKELAEKLVNNAFDTIKDYSWEKIAKEYYEKIYRKVFDR